LLSSECEREGSRESSTDSNYSQPASSTLLHPANFSLYISAWRVFDIFDQLDPTATWLDQLPAWFLQVGAFFLNQLLGSSNFLSRPSVPKQWKQASVRPVP